MKLDDLRKNPGTLLDWLDDAAQAALAAGVLHPIETEQHIVKDKGVDFVARVVSNLQRKERQVASAGNPFLPYDEAMHVADVSDTHVALLNKFNVLARHLLIVTREFEDQETLLTPADFEALQQCMDEYNGLGFYNGGMEAGASQRHKHLQLVALPLGTAGPAIPLEPLILGAGLPFPHALVRLEPGSPATPEDSYEIYRGLLSEVGDEPRRCGGETRQAAPYNLLVTRSWMLLVPRSREHYQGVSINALGFAGSLFLRKEKELESIREVGPLTALRIVTHRGSTLDT